MLLARALHLSTEYSIYLRTLGALKRIPSRLPGTNQRGRGGAFPKKNLVAKAQVIGLARLIFHLKFGSAEAVVRG